MTSPLQTVSAACDAGAARHQEKNRDYDRQRAMHEQLFRGVIGRQALQSFGPKDRYAVLFHLEDRDRRIRTNDGINPCIENLSQVLRFLCRILS